MCAGEGSGDAAAHEWSAPLGSTISVYGTYYKVIPVERSLLAVLNLVQFGSSLELGITFRVDSRPGPRTYILSDRVFARAGLDVQAAGRRCRLIVLFLIYLKYVGRFRVLL